MSQEELEFEVKSIGDYLGCNAAELCNEIKKLINQHVKEVIGKDMDMPIYRDSIEFINYEKGYNKAKAEQRKRAEL